MEAGAGIEPVYRDVQWNFFVQVIVFKYLKLKNVRCVCKCVNLCAASKQELCVEHEKCPYHNQVLQVKYTESCNTKIKIIPKPKAICKNDWALLILY